MTVSKIAKKVSLLVLVGGAFALNSGAAMAFSCTSCQCKDKATPQRFCLGGVKPKNPGCAVWCEDHGGEGTPDGAGGEEKKSSKDDDGDDDK